MLSLQRHRQVPQLSWNRAAGVAEGEGVHVVLSARERELSELPGDGRL